MFKLTKNIELTEKMRVELPEEEVPASPPTPIYKPSMTSKGWNIFTGQLGVAVWLYSLPAPAHLLLAEHGKLKTSVYYQHSSHTKYKTQQLPGGKVTPSQLKPGHKLSSSHLLSADLFLRNETEKAVKTMFVCHSFPVLSNRVILSSVSCYTECIAE